MNTQKVIIGVAAAIGIVYLLRKVMKANASSDATANPTEDSSEIGGNQTQTRAAFINVPASGSPGVRTAVVWTDTTTRRCFGPDGKAIYVKGPCPSYR